MGSQGRHILYLQCAHIYVLSFEDDHTDQNHDETARQSRWAFGIGLTILGFQVQIESPKAPTKIGAFGFLAGSQAGKARDCYSRHAQVRILPGQPDFGSLVQ